MFMRRKEDSSNLEIASLPKSIYMFNVTLKKIPSRFSVAL